MLEADIDGRTSRQEGAATAIGFSLSVALILQRVNCLRSLSTNRYADVKKPRLKVGIVSLPAMGLARTSRIEAFRITV